MTPKEIEATFEKLSNDQKISLLLQYGHCLSILAREAYEFQGPGVTNPELLRGINEIFHRIFPRVATLINDNKPNDSVSSVIHWIVGNGDTPEIQKTSISAFKMAVERCNS